MNPSRYLAAAKLKNDREDNGCAGSVHSIPTTTVPRFGIWDTFVNYKFNTHRRAVALSGHFGKKDASLCTRGHAILFVICQLGFASPRAPDVIQARTIPVGNSFASRFAINLPFRFLL